VLVNVRGCRSGDFREVREPHSIGAQGVLTPAGGGAEGLLAPSAAITLTEPPLLRFRMLAAFGAATFGAVTTGVTHVLIHVPWRNVADPAPPNARLGLIGPTLEYVVGK
jgi:hypothetical protein